MELRYSMFVALLCLSCSGVGREAADSFKGDLAGDDATVGEDGAVGPDRTGDSTGIPDGLVEDAADAVPGELPLEDEHADVLYQDAPADLVADVKPPCGDPVVAENYPKCTGADDQEACEAAGGTWTIVGLAPEPECQCPTGQGGCSCKSPADCMSSCVADFVGGQMFDCEGVTSGHCSPVSITVGCWCYFMQDGSVMGLCAD